MYEVINHYNSKVSNEHLFQKYKVNHAKYYIVSFHREENLLNDYKVNEFIKIINFLAKYDNLPVLISAHPRLRNILKTKITKKKLNKNINVMKPFSFTEYLKLQDLSKMVISDSGSIAEETSLLNLKSIIIRDTFERQEILQKSSTLISNLNLENFKKIFRIENTNLKFDKSLNEYKNPDFSKNLSRIISSKIPYIKKYIWNKK